MHYILALLFTFLFVPGNGDQSPGNPAASWDVTILSEANTAKNVSYLSSEEQKVIYYINLVRSNPALFGKTFLKHYVDSAKTNKSKYLSSLKTDLQKGKPCGMLTPEMDLTKEARNHARDLGVVGKIGHNASDGQSFTGRISELKKKYAFVAETCQYGYSDALSIVIDLLIDEGVEDLGHRKILLDPDLQFAGVAIEPHKRYKHNCVIDLGSFNQR